MQPDYTALEALSAQDALTQPETLLKALEQACPLPSHFNGDNFDYGTSFDERIIRVLESYVRYAQTQPFKLYTDFEKKLGKASAGRLGAVLKDSGAFDLVENKDATAGDVKDFLAKCFEQMNSPEKQRQDHVAKHPVNLKMAMRHALCRLNQSLRRAMDEKASAAVKAARAAQAAQEEEPADFINAPYDPVVEAAKDGLDQLFEKVIENDPLFRFPDEFHMQVASHEFLPQVKAMNLFPESDKVTADDMDYYAAFFESSDEPPPPAPQ